MERVMICSVSQSLAEFDLRSVKYEIKSARSHEMRLNKPPHDCLTFTFRSEQEAQEWGTVMMSSLRESHRGQRSLLRSVISSSLDQSALHHVFGAFKYHHSFCSV